MPLPLLVPNRSIPSGPQSAIHSLPSPTEKIDSPLSVDFLIFKGCLLPFYFSCFLTILTLLHFPSLSRHFLVLRIPSHLLLASCTVTKLGARAQCHSVLIEFPNVNDLLVSGGYSCCLRAAAASSFNLVN